MKLIMSIIHDEDASRLLSRLSKKGFYTTKLASSGGFLKVGSTTIIAGVEEEKVQEVLDIIHETCKTTTTVSIAGVPTIGGERIMDVPVEVTSHGATVFVLDVDQFHKF